MTANSYVRGVAAAAGLLWLATLLAGLLVAVVPGAAPAVRNAFAFRLDIASSGTWNEAVGYFTTNIRVLGAVLLAAWARMRIGVLARVLDIAVVTLVTANVGLVGAAVGAYGVAALPWLTHLPLEWAALATVVRCYVLAGSAKLTALVYGRHGVIGAVALAAAAAAETFAGA